jgi:hypothetical protein
MTFALIAIDYFFSTVFTSLTESSTELAPNEMRGQMRPGVEYKEGWKGWCRGKRDLGHEALELISRHTYLQ